MLNITPALTIDERHLEERFVRASGPGGQNVNKVSTAVELRFDLAAASLPEDVKARLRLLAGSRLTVDDVLVVDAREHRTQAQNREAARARLIELLQRAAKKPRPRRATKPGRAAKERRIAAKKGRGEIKRARSSRPSDD